MSEYFCTPESVYEGDPEFKWQATDKAAVLRVDVGL
jgi:hypothetical protein